MVLTHKQLISRHDRIGRAYMVKSLAKLIIFMQT